jgi:hypothetical protein
MNIRQIAPEIGMKMEKTLFPEALEGERSLPNEA